MIRLRINRSEIHIGIDLHHLVYSNHFGQKTQGFFHEQRFFPKRMCPDILFNHLKNLNLYLLSHFFIQIGNPKNSVAFLIFLHPFDDTTAADLKSSAQSFLFAHHIPGIKLKVLKRILKRVNITWNNIGILYMFSSQRQCEQIVFSVIVFVVN